MTRADGGRQGMVIAGGGARAAYGVGVMKALFNGESPATNYVPINPDVFAGTSAGAWNAAVLVSHPGTDMAASVEYLENMWLEEVPGEDPVGPSRVFRYRIDPFQLLNLEYLAQNPLGRTMDVLGDTAFLTQDVFRRSVNFFLSSGTLQRRTLELMDMSPLISTQPLEKLIAETVNLEEIRRSTKKVRITATRWRSGDVRIFTNQDLTEEVGHKAILASASVPGIFPPIEIDGEIYVDGGVVMNTPLKPAIDAGAETLHVIYQDPSVEAVPLAGVRNTIDTLNRILIIGLAANVNQDIGVAARVNEALDALDKVPAAVGPAGADRDALIRAAAAGAGSLSERETQALILAAGLAPQSANYRKLTIHRYHPTDDLGGVFKMLSFRRRTVSSLIERGFQDAMNHDCALSECVLP